MIIKKRYEDIKNDLSKLIIQSSIINIDKKLKQKTQNIKVKSNTTKNKFLAMVE
jgi:anthranilate synthase component 1